MPVCPVSARSRSEQLEVTSNYKQQIVEIVRDTTRKMAHGLHSLGLPERRLGAFALDLFDFKFVRSLRDSLFEVLTQLTVSGLARAQRLLRPPALKGQRGLICRDAQQQAFDLIGKNGAA